MLVKYTGVSIQNLITEAETLTHRYSLTQLKTATSESLRKPFDKTHSPKKLKQNIYSSQANRQ